MRDTTHLKYSTLVLSPVKSRNSVVIPVINEGTRLNALLTRMKELGITDLFDVVVVDGGSTDGSIDVDEFSKLGVNSVITKESDGALGTQLQCAYDFCLSRGYEGVITIDGNNKDNPAFIFGMEEALLAGADFVQGSRFVTGGSHSNTPLHRLLAVRFIHAPLLSFSSRFRWTDTTQGFRAYSNKLLQSEQLSIFRPEFYDYTLLFFLNHAAPRLGFRCMELGTERAYPRNAPTPTKIRGSRQLIRLLKSLFLVCAGTYDLHR